MTSVAVVGGGAVGVTAASELAERRATVTLYEKSSVAGGSTGRAAGVVYDAFAASADARLGGRAVERFRELSGEGGFEFVQTPYCWFAREGDERTANAIRRQVPRMRENGRDVSIVDPSELRARFPGLVTDGIGVAAVAENAGHTVPRTYAELLARKAEAAGATIHTGVEARLDVEPVGVNGERYDSVLVAAGAHSKRLLADVDVRIPLKPYRTQALTCGVGDEPFPMTYDATEGYYFRPHSAGLLAGDGTEAFESDPDSWNRDADPAFRDAMRERLAGRLSDAADEITDSWAGICTATPDRDPLVGELRPGIHVATGWQGHGFMRAPALGEVAARTILGAEGPSQFDPNRFTGDEEFDVVEGMMVY